MRLVAVMKRLDRAEERAKFRRRRREPIAVVWGEREVLAGGDLAEGEHVAVDVYQHECDGYGLPHVRTVERVTRSPGDLGVVYGPEGGQVGRVVERDGTLITVAYGA